MKNRNKGFLLYSFIIISILLLINCKEIFANNLTISNVELGKRDPSSNKVMVSFDISWENSWRTKINHDAIWITTRLYNPSVSPTNKILCNLSSSGINPDGTSIDSDYEIFVPSDKKGVFLRSSVYGYNSNVSLTNVQLTLDYSTCGFAPTDNVKVSVFGIEMAYVPEGSFYAGDYDSSTYSLDQGSADSDPWHIDSSSVLSVSNIASGGYRYISGNNTNEDATGSSFILSTDFPKGYSSFYAMKYEITEGQWVEFFNSLPSAAAREQRDITDSNHKNSDLVVSRNTISCSGSPLICSTSRPARPVSYLSWMDLSAFLDWDALRPMTELEYEKMSRGPIIPIPGGFAWGNTDITAASSISAGDEDGSEIIENTDANANFNDSTFTGGDSVNGYQYSKGPLRTGIFSTSSSPRENAGAGYYGIMELSGNLKERVVTIGNSAGRTFIGSNGDGILSINNGCEGNANQSDWPGIDNVASCGITGADGSGFKGGSWEDGLSGARLRISDRYEAAKADVNAYGNSGGRGARTDE